MGPTERRWPTTFDAETGEQPGQCKGKCHAKERAAMMFYQADEHYWPLFAAGSENLTLMPS